MSQKDIVLALIMCDGNLILLHHNEINRLTAPMGKVETGETHGDALVREMFEELDIHIKFVRCLTDFKIYFKDVLKHIYVSEVLSFNGQPINKEPHKHAELIMLSYDELVTYQAEGLLDIALLKCLELDLIRPLFISHSNDD